MNNFYEGDNKVNKVKLRGFRMRFESFRMHDGEDIAYFLRVDEVVNTIRGLDENLDEYVVVQKVLIYLLGRFNPKFSAIKEMNNMKTLIIDQLLGILLPMR